MMKMANCDRERIGSIVRFRYGRQRKQRLHNLLYLKFFSVAMTNNRLLDESG